MKVLYVIIAIIIFGILIAVHEFGHFASAKSLGVRVNEFSIGMGPAIFKRSRGETLYSLRAFPIGGFCAMEGEDDRSDDPRAFTNKRAWRRLIILIAGSFMNFLLGFIIVLIIYANAGGFRTAEITAVDPALPAVTRQSVMAGDVVREIDGHRIHLYSDIPLFLNRGDGDGYDITVIRGDEKLTFENLPLTFEYETEDGQRAMQSGLSFDGVIKGTVGVKLKVSFWQCIDFVRMIIMSFRDLFSGAAGFKDLSGPVGIVGMIADVGQGSANIKAAFGNIAYIAAFIAVNLAVVNMLPLPALDGGRVFILVVTTVIEKIRRRRIDPKYEGYIHTAGLVFFFGLMIVVAFQDVFKLIVK
ncbi:MAG: site-2 protease family protein [Oscillospiraceae bacterium]|nr:site-2 protease family protein [Oscillospiraceae bacterium]